MSMKNTFDAKYFEVIEKLKSSKLPVETKNSSLITLKEYKTDIENLINQIKSHNTNSPSDNTQVIEDEIYTNVLSQLNSLFDNLNSKKESRSVRSITKTIDQFSRPPIFIPALVNDVKTLRLLCADGANVLVQDPFFLKNTPLLWAIANSSVQAACTLLDKSVVTCVDTMFKQINQTDSKRTTPLILSVSKGYTHVIDTNKTNDNQGKIIDRLLELGAHVNLQDELGFSALHYACLHQNLKLTASLLSHGANPFLINLKGETPLILLNKRRDQRSALLKHACSVFTLEPDNLINKQEIEALLRSKMVEMADKSTRQLDLSTVNKKRPLGNTQESIGTSSLNNPADLAAKSQQIVRPLKNPTSSIILKSNTTFLMRFLASPLTKSAFVLLVLSSAVFGLIGGGFLIGLGAIASSSALLLTSVGLFAGGGYKAVSQTDKKAFDNTII